jgi:hypothetical protein
MVANSLFCFWSAEPSAIKLCYKHVTIVNDDSSDISKGLKSLIDDAKVIIYDRKMFIKQAMIDLPLFFCSGG